MVSRFRRTLSFPKLIISEKSYHVRSASLPCRSHPLISQLNDEINDLKTWQSQSNHPNSSWLCDGLMRLKNIHDSLNDLLQLPKTQESLRRRPNWVEKLLEEFLGFVDVYGIFRATLVSIQEEQSLAQVAIRRKDESNMVSYLKNRKILDKNMRKLHVSLQSVSPHSIFAFDDDAELAGILRDVNVVTVSVTTSMLNGISGSSMKSKSYIRMKLSNNNKSEERIREFEHVENEMFTSLKNQGDEEVKSLLRKMKEMENCVVEIEIESGKMFRSLINTRVFLLNILTQ